VVADIVAGRRPEIGLPGPQGVIVSRAA
jgi:hypothetical protein